MTRLAAFLEQQFPRMNLVYRDKILRVCSAFELSGKADDGFVGKLCSGEFWSRLTEALVFERICDKLFGDRAVGVGPDFLLLADGRKVWIEVVCPGPAGLTEAWQKVSNDIDVTTEYSGVPSDSILLRWTSAIQAKTNVLLGTAETPGYIAKGVVSDQDIYVIAVNGCQLRHGPFSAFRGISQYPCAVEAVAGIGAYQIHIDQQTRRASVGTHQTRLSILNRNQSPVETAIFLDERYKLVSAIYAVDFDGSRVVGNEEPSAVVHNPLALNPLPKGFLPCDHEYEIEAWDPSE